MKNLLILVLLSYFLPTGVVAFAAKRGKSDSKSAKSNGGGFGTKTSPITHTPDESPSTQALVQFVKAQGSKGIANVDIGIDPDTGRRGLFAMKNFKKGQFLCQVPSDCALALSDPNKNGEDAPTVAHTGSNFVTMYLQQENMKKAFAPYLDSLPTKESSQYSPTPDYFNDEEIDLLEFPRLVRQTKERKANIQEVAAAAGLSQEELQFATWLVASRSFSFSMTDPNEEGSDDLALDEKGQIITKGGDNKTKIRVMVPFVDMVNHSSDQPNAKLTIIDPEKDESMFALEATRPIPQGKEIVISYGTSVESSVELLLNYGFVPSSNPIDQFMLQKGGDEVITSLDGWTTTPQEDKSMLAMLDGDDEESATLKKILSFRLRLKEAYSSSDGKEKEESE